MNGSNKNCVIDCRVSSTKQLEGDSLENQEQLARTFAERNGWNITKVFSKQYSSSQNVRTDFDEIVSYIKTSKVPIHCYIFKSIDRFTRSGVGAYLHMTATLKALGVEVVDIYGIIQPEQNTLEHLGFSYEWSTYSPTEAAQILEAHRSKQEVRDILTRMIGAEISLVQNGYKVRQPNDGFVNKRIYVEGKKRMIQVPDPKRAHFFVEMFRLRAAGILDDPQIVDRINALGYRSRPQKRWNHQGNTIIGRREGKPLTVKQMQRFIQRSIYAGALCEKWTGNQPIRAQYDGLVSVELFNKANRGKVFIHENSDGSLKLLKDYHQNKRSRTPRIKNNPLYPYKAIVLCPHCSKPLLGSASVGKLKVSYPAYHCGRNGHYLRIPKQKFDEAVETYLESISLKPVFLDELERCLIAKYEQRIGEIRKETERALVNLGELEAEQSEAVVSLITTQSPLVCAKIEERIEQLETRIALVKNHGHDSKLSATDIRAFIQYAKKRMEHPGILLKNNGNLQKQATCAGLIFDQLPTYEQICNGTPKLTPVFALSQSFNEGKSLSVNSLYLKWNFWENLMNDWITVFKMLEDER